MDKRFRIHPGVRANARSLRRNQTRMERRLWQRLRRKQLGGLHFRRQHAIERFIVDFCCPAKRLVIEVDGESHNYQADYDEERTVWLQARGYRVLRFTNVEIRENLEGVLQRISAYAEQLGS